MSVPFRPLALALVAALASCSTSPWYDDRFSPSPLEVQVSSSADPAAQVRALVTVRGVSKGKDGGPDAVEVRMRLENLGTRKAVLDQQALSLVSGDLVEFGPPTVVPAPQTIAPQGAQMLDLIFPLPQGMRRQDLSLRGLNLRWTIDFEGRRVTTGASFQRVEMLYVHDEPRVHVGIGVGTTID